MNGAISAPVRFGLLRLVDSAPAVVALRRGLFRELGLKVELSVEPSWANIADKLAYGLLDAASMLPPLALAAALGLRGMPGRLLVPMGLSAGGNTITIGRAAAEAVLDSGATERDALTAGRRFGTWLRAQSSPPRFAVVHAFSTHNLLLRYWLAASGFDPDRDVTTVVIPPEHVEPALAEGRIAGFCAGAPWGALAAEHGSGRELLGTSAIWGGHPEKCLALAAPWADANPEAVQALLRGLLQAQRICDDADGHVAPLLAEAPLKLPLAASSACLLPGATARETIRFHAGAVWFPWRSHGAWFLAQMRRWGWLSPEIDLAEAARRVYRPDLLRAAAAEEGLSWPDRDSKPEGAHAAAWMQPGQPMPLTMMADRFCDGAVFDRNGA